MQTLRKSPTHSDGSEGDAHNEDFGVLVNTLSAGDFFGETALLNDGRRTATVVASSKTVTCFVLAKKSFDRMVTTETLLQDVSETMIQRKRSALHEVKKAESKLMQEMQLNELRAIKILGSGAFGKVFLVQHDLPNGEHGGLYALKCMKKQIIVDRGFFSNVAAEKQALVDLKHPFVVQLVKPFCNRTHLFLLMELIQAGELYRLIKFRKHKTRREDTALPIPMARFYAGCVASALTYMHRRHYVFRDLKPENLMLDKFGFVKLVDFGMAKRLFNDKTYTLCGTREYLAPELMAGKGYGYSVDWWAFGVLIYEMVFGYTPFSDISGTRVMHRIATASYNFPPVSGSKRRHKGGQERAQLQDIVGKLLVLDISKRLNDQGVKMHSWFSAISWNQLNTRKIMPPWIPKVEEKQGEGATGVQNASCTTLAENLDWSAEAGDGSEPPNGASDMDELWVSMAGLPGSSPPPAERSIFDGNNL